MRLMQSRSLPDGSRGHDALTIGLIGLAHATSHFFHMLLPPMFPWLIDAFGLGYSQLGLLVSVFFVVSGTGQALAGFLVDRVGARPILYVAMLCFATAGAAAAMASGYSGLMVAAALAGLGNAPFHPVDFTILNKRVSQARLGHAFSVHGISGNLGWAFAPIFLLGVTTATGSWRAAYGAAALVPLAVLAVLVWQRRAVDDRLGSWAPSVEPRGQPASAVPEHPMAFLRLPSVWLCFSFFFWTTVTLSAVQSFAGPALMISYGLPKAWSSMLVTGYMICGALGMLLGGFLAVRAERLERVIAASLLTCGALLVVVGFGWVQGIAAAWLVILAGLGSGLAGPSRDMLIKRAAPPGATGRVYGTVYSGLDLGFALAAPVLGALMDRGQPLAIFLVGAGALVVGVASAAWVGRGVGGGRARPAAKMA
jgi:FSR family fosmidomycin resistance protein-like MFS transporter